MKRVLSFILLTLFLTQRSSSGDSSFLPSYTVVWPKKLDESIVNALSEHSSLIKFEKRSIFSYVSISQRAKTDLKIFKKILKGLGYLEAKIDFDIQKDYLPIRIKFRIILGPRYTINEIKIDNKKHPIFLKPSEIYNIFQIQPGDFIDIRKINSGIERLEKYLLNHGFPFAKTQECFAKTLENPQKSVLLFIPITSGSHFFWGKIKIEGLQKLKPSFITNRISWKEGCIYQVKEIEKTKKALLSTGLFSKISIKPIPNKNNPDQKVDIKIKANETAPRIIGGGANYSSVFGIGTNFFWAHNNLLGGGETLGTNFKFSSREMKARLSYEVPDFYRKLHKLTLETEGLKERLKAYKAKTFLVGGRLEKPILENITGSIGTQFETGTIIGRNNDSSVFRPNFFSIPFKIQIDKRDDLLDPTKGFWNETQWWPYFGLLRFQQSQNQRTYENYKNFHVIKSSSSFYLPAFYRFQTPFLVLSGFLRGGTIFTTPTKNIPPNKRFFSGGANSIRGYGYQMLGPLNPYGAPTGGSSLFEYGGEIRSKFTETIGSVMFIEAGKVSSSPIPFFNRGKTLIGGGIGGRYYSSIGPIRVDIAFPFKRRRTRIGNKKIDSPIQFYISIGQAF